MKVFELIRPSSREVPILLSVPHCGTDFPSELRNEFNPRLIEKPDDTDWFVHKLYDFAPAMGITIIHAVFSRWVVDLNRDPQGHPLYSDGRLITGVCPTTTFLGQPLYRDGRQSIDSNEISRRLEIYFNPYHQQLEFEIRQLKKDFGNVLLWDCHSIRQVVRSIQPNKFPDLILGDADETSASKELVKAALEVLGQGTYSLQHNHPFKGGHITRHFGRPATGVHALQLEMTKVNYMDDEETSFDPSRAGRMAELLKRVFSRLLSVLEK